MRCTAFRSPVAIRRHAQLRRAALLVPVAFPAITGGQTTNHTPLKVGQLEMFVDEANILSRSANTTLTLEQAVRTPHATQPGLVHNGATYEGKPDWGSVVYDPQDNQSYSNQVGAYKMWFSTSGGGTPMCYMTSRDGVTWDYPNFQNNVNSTDPARPGYQLGKLSNGQPRVYNPHNVEFIGYRNFTTHGQREGYFFPIGGTSVIIDPNKSYGQPGRYKMIYNDMTLDANGNGIGHELYPGSYSTNDPLLRNAGDVGIITAESADGITWTRAAPITRTATATQVDAAAQPIGPVTHSNSAIEPRQQATNDNPLYFKRKEGSVSDTHQLMYDAQKDKFVIYSKGWRWIDKPSNPGTLIANYRTITRTETVQTVAQNPNAFLGDWTQPQLIIEPTQRIAGVDDPNVAGTDPATINDAQFMGSGAFEYEGLYFQVLNQYHYQGSFLIKPDKNPNDPDAWSTTRPPLSQGGQKIDFQLAVSRNGVDGWTRVGNYATFLPVGQSGKWDDGIMMAYNPTVGHDGDLRFYYQGWNGTHDPYDHDGDGDIDAADNLRTDSGVGLATRPGGRLVSVSADLSSTLPELTTKTLTFNVDNLQLLINADLTGGAIDVGISGFKYGARVDYVNFMVDNSELTQVDALYYLVTWDPGRMNLHDLFNKTGRLEFHITGDAKLYGYKFVTPGAFSMTAVPEPTTALLLSVGTASLLMTRRRR